MIRIERIPTPPPVPTTPHYILHCDYIVGDTDRNEGHQARLSLSNPYVERFVTLLEKFQDYELYNDIIKNLITLGELNVDDADFMYRCMFPSTYKTSKKTKAKFQNETTEQTGYLDEFQYCIELYDHYDQYYLTLADRYLRYIDEHSFEYYAIVEPNDTYVGP